MGATKTRSQNKNETYCLSIEIASDRSEIMTMDNKEKSTESQSTPTKRDADTIEPGSENKKRKIDQTQAILEKIKRSSPKKESSQSVFA